MAKEKFDHDFSSWCNLRLKFGKIASRFTLTEGWETGNYHIIFWSMTSKAEFSSESMVQFLYICSIYVAPTHLATIFYRKMERLWQLPASHCSVKNLEVIFKTLNANHTIKKLPNGIVFSHYIRKARPLYTYKKPTTDIYTSR